MPLQPFTLAVPETVLDDLKERLSRTRWTNTGDGADWTFGVDQSYLQELADHWLHGYDWRKQERNINALPQFTTRIDGINIHFVHQRAESSNATPFLLPHGWPDCFYRFHKILPMLTNTEANAFDVVVPSIPGYGFSERKSMTSSAVADLWAKLMAELGYEQYVAAGGDMGTRVTKALALQHPQAVKAIHLTDVDYPTGKEDPSSLSDAEKQFAEFIQGWWFKEGAYAMLQMTKPQSLAFGLNDSPVGLAVWIVSFINTGARDHQVEESFGGRDELLTNIMIYWITQTAGSAARMYFEDARAGYAQEDAPQKSEAPAAIALFPREAPFPREWAERTLNVQRFTTMPRGGHFAALEEPELLANDIRDFVADLQG